MRRNNNGKMFFEFEDVIAIIRELSYSQGFYGRLLRDINELSKEELHDFAIEIESENFTSALDVVMYFEG